MYQLRSIGTPDPKKKSLQGKPLQDGCIPTWFGEEACQGNEAALTNFPGVSFRNTSDECELVNFLAVVCFTGSAFDPGDVLSLGAALQVTGHMLQQ